MEIRKLLEHIGYQLLNLVNYFTIFRRGRTIYRNIVLKIH